MVSPARCTAPPDWSTCCVLLCIEIPAQEGGIQKRENAAWHYFPPKLGLHIVYWWKDLKEAYHYTRGLEESLRSLEVDKGYFGLSDIAKDSNALIKETKQMVHLAEFRKLSKDDSTPKERQWLELVAEHGKAQAVREDRIVAWVKYRLEPHMKVELRNLENQGVKCDTLEEVYNQLCVKFMCPETLDEVELQLRDIRQGKKEKFFLTTLHDLALKNKSFMRHAAGRN